MLLFMENSFICPKCECKGIWKPYKVMGKGCSYCKPVCNYCKKVMSEILMEHHSKCKAFQEFVKKEQEKN